MANTFEQSSVQPHRHINNFYMVLQCTNSCVAHATLSLSLHSPKHSTASPIPDQSLPTHTPSIIRFHRIHHNKDIRSTYRVVISSSRTQHWSHTWAGRGRSEEGNKSAERPRAEPVCLATFSFFISLNMFLIDGLSCQPYRGHPVHHLHQNLPPHPNYVSQDVP